MTDKNMQELIDLALLARNNAYVPYSNYPVGAALRTKSGKVYTGANIENASYPLTICGERNAMFQAVADGSRDFETLVIATRDGGSPCGACRQVMIEFSLDMDVVIVDEQGKITLRATPAELLPGAFTSISLK
jgi:cytidine deaminase